MKSIKSINLNPLKTQSTLPYKYLLWVGSILGVMGLYMFTAYSSPQAVPTCDMPANEDANPTTIAVLHYFCRLKRQHDNRVVSGQHISHSGWESTEGYEAFVEGLHDETGYYVGLIGSGMTHSTLTETVTILANYWDAGGFVQADAHFDNPWTGGDSWVTDTDAAKPNLLELIPGEDDFDPDVYENWQAQLDNTASGLEALRDRGVVVLWRPLHEMNGVWFWWGVDKTNEENTDPYKKLWRSVFRYYSETKGLDNLIWVYAPIISWDQTVLAYYPGDNYVDMVGLDYYDDELDPYNYDYIDLLTLRKPMGFTEVGPRTKRGSWDTQTIIQSIRYGHPQFVFFMEWSSWDEGQVALVDNLYAEHLLADPWVITRDEIEIYLPHKAYIPLIVK